MTTTEKQNFEKLQALLTWHKSVLEVQKREFACNNEPLRTSCVANCLEEIDYVLTWLRHETEAAKVHSESRIYVAGPMKGLPNYNYGAFDEVARILTLAGFHVENPAQIGRDLGVDPMLMPADHDWNETPKNFRILFKRDLEALSRCNALYLLDGWEKSKGATAERAVAVALGMKVYETDEEKNFLTQGVNTGKATK